MRRSGEGAPSPKSCRRHSPPAASGPASPPASAGRVAGGAAGWPAPPAGGRPPGTCRLPRVTPLVVRMVVHLRALPRALLLALAVPLTIHSSSLPSLRCLHPCRSPADPSRGVQDSCDAFGVAARVFVLLCCAVAAAFSIHPHSCRALTPTSLRALPAQTASLDLALAPSARQMTFYVLFAMLTLSTGLTVSPTTSPSPTPCSAPPGYFCSGGSALICPIGSYCAGASSPPSTLAPAWQQVGSNSAHSGAQLQAPFLNGTVLWVKQISSVQGSVVVSANTTVFVAGGSTLYAINGYTNFTLWTSTFTSAIAAGPVLSTDSTIVYIVSSSLLFAVNSSTGLALYNVSIGSASSLTVASISGMDYLFSLRTNPPLLTAIKSANWTAPVWTFSGIGTAFTAAATSVDSIGGLVFQGGSDVIGNPGNRVYALNATTGVTKWVVATSYPACAISGFPSSGYSAGKVIVGLSSFTALRQLSISSGATINTFSIPGGQQISCNSFATVLSTGIAVASGISGAGTVYFLNNSGTQLRQNWNVSGAGNLLGTAVAINSGSPVLVFLDALGKVYFVNISTGVTLGIYDTKVASACQVSVSYDGIVYFTTTGRLYAIRGYQCPASFYCFSGAPVLCPPGFFCPLSSINALLCPKGTFSNAGAADCTICPAGTYSSSTGSTSCQQCPSGHYCPAGTSSWARLNCGRGNYCPDGSGSPTPCPYQVPPTGGWGALQFQGPAFLVETAHCFNHCFWNFTSGDGVLSKC